MRLGAVEGGGTTFEVAVGRLHRGEVREEERAAFPTADPTVTLARVRGWLAPRGVSAVGVACFGPLALPAGRLWATPKAGWDGVDLRAALAPLGVPLAVDTDVNAAALAEHRWGAAQDHDVAAYVTVGTGVGGGLVVRGTPVHGAMHPEMGHLPSPRADDFAGVCPFHGACVEGLVSGPAIAARTGRPPASLSDDHPVWDVVAAHLGELAAVVALTTAAGCLVFGGGVVRARPFLLAGVEAAMRARLAGYLRWASGGSPVRLARLARPGLWGAFALAADATR